MSERVLILEGGRSHRHRLLDMPLGIFKMIKGSKFMRYHHTVPQAHLHGRVHDIPQANVLGGGVVRELRRNSDMLAEKEAAGNNR